MKISSVENINFVTKCTNVGCHQDVFIWEMYVITKVTVHLVMKNYFVNFTTLNVLQVANVYSLLLNVMNNLLLFQRRYILFFM